jgi:gliding motility-associated-like protein
MKRILYSCLILLSLLGFTHVVKSQNPLYFISPNDICSNPSGVYQTTAEILNNWPGATTYSWTVLSSVPGCNPTFTAVVGPSVTPGGPVTNTAINITMPCCGTYTVNCFAWQNNIPLGLVDIAPLFSAGFTVGVINCPTGAGITPSSQAICQGSAATITGSGANTYTWSNGFVGNPLVVSPNVNTCFTFTGTTAQGCTVTPPAPACVSVQAITSTVTPASQTMCAGSPVSFTAAAAPVTGTNVAGGTMITGYQWYQPTPPGGPLLAGATATDLAQPGTYSVVITHTGAAGTCTVEGQSNVVIGTAIPVSISPTSPSVCPGAAATLTAISIQTTAASNFTWTANSVSGTTVSTFNGSVVTFPSIDPVTTVTVDVDYFGCPGQATVDIGLLVLTPTLTSSSPSTCPGQSLTLTASGGVTYTFSAMPIPLGTTITPLDQPTANTATHTAAAGSLPIQYCVTAYSTGCTGTTCIIVDTKTLYPTLVPSSPSVCPGTQFSLTAMGSGVSAGSSYTFSSSYNPAIATGTDSSVSHQPPGSSTLFPHSYTVTVDSAGCTGTAFVQVDTLIMNPGLTSPSPSICAGTPVTLSTLTGSNTVTQHIFTSSDPGFAPSGTATIVNSFFENTVVHTPPPTATVVNYTVSVDSVGCRGSSSYSIGILDLGPNLSLSTIPNGSICPGSINSLTINATGALNYTFTAPSTGTFHTGTGASSSNTVAGITTAPPSIPLSGAVYTIQADSSSCVGTKTIAIHELKINPGIMLYPTLVCSGQSVAVTATNVGSNPVNPTTYSFFAMTPPGPLPNPLPSAPNVSFAIDHPTNQVIYSVMVDSSGCTGILPPPTATISIRPDLPLIPSTTNASVCPGLKTTLSVTAPTTALSYTYTWSQISGTSQITPPMNTQSIVAYPITNSTYSVHVLDSLGCVGNTVINVGIDPALSFSVSLASSGSTICSGQHVTLTASSTVALNNSSIGNINYTWTPNSGINPNTGTTVVSAPSITTVYTVTADNGYGCVGQNTITVPVGLYPNPSIVASAGSVCVGFTSTLTAFGGNYYTWTSHNTFTGTVSQQSIAAVPGGNYTVTVSNGGGCTRDTSIFIGTLPNLTITATASSPTTCITSNSPKFSKAVQLSASGAGTYVWFPYTPIYMTYSLGSTTEVRPPATTQYTVIGSTAICSGTTVIQVDVIPQFTINVTPPLPAMCLGDSLRLDVVNIGTAAVGPPSAFTYSWTEALNAPPISISDYFTPSVMIYPQNTTTYTTEVRDSRACISIPRLVTVTVLPRPLTSIAIPTINSVPTNTVCYVGLNPGADDVTINLTAYNTNQGLQFGVVPTYTWVSPYPSTYPSILTPGNNNAVIVKAPLKELNGSAVAIYTVISGYNGVQGCKRMDTVSVRVVDCRPIRAIKFDTAEEHDTICARTCITFLNHTDTMAGGPQTYTWTFRGGAPATSTLTHPTVCYNYPNAKGYDVILQVSNPYPLINPSGGPSGSSMAMGFKEFIKVVEVPNVTIVSPGQLKSDTTVRFGQSVDLKGSGAFTYEWSPPYNISSLTRPDVTVNPFQTTQYILKGFNSKGCYSSDTLNVIVVKDCGEMYVPNAFTPNDDGENDVLYVRGICLQSLTFMIFNRWGEKVFETNDQNVGWNGTYKGEELNTGVFVYRLEGKTYDGKGYSSKGNITLIR